MDLNQVAGVLRITVPMLLAYGSSKGWFTPADAGALSDAIVNCIVAGITVGSVVMSVRANSKATQIQNVGNLPDVKVVVGPAAPEPAQAAAADAAQPGVVAK